MFINDFKILCVKNSNVTSYMLDNIIRIKQEYWDYLYESHVKWINDNIDNEEYHLIIMSVDDEIIAYLNIINTFIVYNNIIEEVIGIGNVCVDKKYSGHGVGKLLMSVCNYYIDRFDKRAILLCKEQLIKFYEKSGWIRYKGEVYIKGTKFLGEVMFTRSLTSPQILLERNF